MSNYARVGGILTILSGVWFILPVAWGALYASMPYFIEGFMKNQPPVQGDPNFPSEFFLIFTIIGVFMCLFFALLGTLAITGGVFALKKKYWAVAVAGAAAGTILFYPCGIAGTILISLGRSEFASGRSAPPIEELQQ
jgi:hypothetical protein